MAASEALKVLGKAGTDEEKIAALLLVGSSYKQHMQCLCLQVAKAVRAGEATAAERRQIFDAVGFPFVSRLLSSEDEPAEEPGRPSPHQELGVTLLACFTTDPQLVSE